MRSEKFYHGRLKRYFDVNFSRYAETAEWYVDPAPNQWMFEVPEKGLKIILTCDENGVVRENRLS